ncbi:MAG: hypothetical protein HYX55_05355 [Chloroflexi bacterium]|nr:hypothetical protein [Chloroflexota bacterium]
MRLLSTLALVAVLAACGGDAPTATAGPAAASTTQGRFALSFAIERSTVSQSAAIAGAATLTLLAPGGATFSGSSTLVGFEFAEVGGKARHVVPVWDDVCAPHRLTTNTPIVVPIAKSGTVVEGPDAAWYRTFLTDPLVHLPSGDWDITALAQFFDGQNCVGQKLDMRVTVRVHVTD